MTNSSLQYYREKSQSLILKNPKKISLLSNFTINGLSDVIKVIAFEQNMHVQIYQCPYDHYRQEIFVNILHLILKKFQNYIMDCQQ